MKLDFGCGKKCKPGYVGVDLRKFPGVDFVCDFWEVPVSSESVSNIHTRHALEHLTYANVARTLDTFFRILEWGGSLTIIVPNLEWHAQQLLGQVHGTHKKGDMNHALAGFYGWQDGGEESIHRSGWTEALMERYLESAGFDKIEMIAEGPHLEVGTRR